MTGTADANGKTLNQFLYIDPADFAPPNLPNGGGITDGNSTAYSDAIIAHEMVHAVMGRSMDFASGTMPKWFKEGMAEFIRGADGRVWGDTTGGTDVTAALAAFNADDVSGSAGYSGGYMAVRYMHQQIKAAGGAGIKDITTYLSTHAHSTLDAALQNASHGAFTNLANFNTQFNTNAAAFLGSMNLTNDDTGAIGGSDVDGGKVMTAESVFSDVGTKFDNQPLSGFNTIWQAGTIGVNSSGGTGNKEVTFQVGSGAEQTLTAQFGGMTAKNLGIDDLDLSKLATIAIVHLDDALNYINEQRASIGAISSRLTSAIDNSQNSVVNKSAALSRIRDTDYASETAKLTRQQILQQAGTAMLAQANSMPQLALALLRA